MDVISNLRAKCLEVLPKVHSLTPLHLVGVLIPYIFVNGSEDTKTINNNIPRMIS
jgi:hypothetical protein